MALRTGYLPGGILFFWLLLTPPGDRGAALAPVLKETRTYRTRTYQFEARVKNNAGVTPFKVGDTISGRFTYDLGGERVRGNKQFGHYEAEKNALVIQSGNLR